MTEERRRTAGHPVIRDLHEKATRGERLADKIASGIGSWRFLIIQTFLVFCWFVFNIIGIVKHWDPYPFILLNLLFSIQAAYTGPVLLLAGNRSAQRDRMMAEHDYDTNSHAEAIVERILTELLTNSETTVAIARKIGAELRAHLAADAEAEGGGSAPGA